MPYQSDLYTRTFPVGLPVRRAGIQLGLVRKRAKRPVWLLDACKSADVQAPLVAGPGPAFEATLHVAGPSTPCYDRRVITRTDVEHVAALARLGLTNDEIERLVPQLSRILEAVGKLSGVDTSSVGPTAQVIALENVMRDDVARPSMEREAALAEAPLREGGLVRVPVVLEQGR